MATHQFTNTFTSATPSDAENNSNGSALSNTRSRRGTFLKWLRKMHGWIGLWGAVLGLLFGGTGILMNHRAVMKIPAMQIQESTVQLLLPEQQFENAHAMANWLQQELKLDRPAGRVRSEPPHPVAWGDKTVNQPGHWMANFSSPQTNIQMDYWVGNHFITVKRNENNVFGTLANLHKGVGVGIGWILLVDTLAGSIILLSLTGVLLWAMMTKRRMIGTGIAVVSTVLAVLFALQAM